MKKEHHIWVWGSLTILPILFRLLFGSIDGNVEFGYNITATHFQIDSIAFGVFSSCLLHQKPSFIRNKYLSSIGWLLITIGISYILSLWQYKYFPLYVLGPTVLNISGTLLLLSLYFNKPLRLASTSLVKTTSKMAYSIYLVHSLVIHVTIYFFNRYHINQLAIQVLVTTSCIFATAYIFYILIERPTVKYRNKWLKI
ncbi:MAG: hypothetical protein EOO42_13710 [Flavobacteriales bacterium]|nr:MAG: hypothetical protein EOO42_13710 [Flavobacteriales bacterium]